jgi:hypothetical protein
MIKNRDLQNGNGIMDRANPHITGAELLLQMEKFGVDQKIRDATVDDNFAGFRDITKPIDVFAMNVITAPRSRAPVGTVVKEHFRSTGIRDGPRPNVQAYDFGKQQCNPTGRRWDKDSVRCFANVWDHEENPQHHCLSGRCEPTNDVNEDMRPKTCSPRDAGVEKCDSALYHSIDNLRKVFGAPRGDDATVSERDWKALWIDSKYPAGFTPGRR